MRVCVCVLLPFGPYIVVIIINSYFIIIFFLSSLLPSDVRVVYIGREVGGVVNPRPAVLTRVIISVSFRRARARITFNIVYLMDHIYIREIHWTKYLQSCQPYAFVWIIKKINIYYIYIRAHYIFSMNSDKYIYM